MYQFHFTSWPGPASGTADVMQLVMFHHHIGRCHIPERSKESIIVHCRFVFQLSSPFAVSKRPLCFEKKEGIWLCPMTKAPTSTEKSKKQRSCTCTCCAIKRAYMKTVLIILLIKTEDQQPTKAEKRYISIHKHVSWWKLRKPIRARQNLKYYVVITTYMSL